MADVRKLLQRNRFTLEILGIVCVAEFIVMQALDAFASGLSTQQANLLDAVSLVLICAPLVFWRSRAVHGRETQTFSRALRSSSHAVVLLDSRGRIYWVNQGFIRTSGYTLEEARGASPLALLGSGLTDAANLAQLRNSRQAGVPCRVEVCNRRKDGSLYWGDLDFRPDFDGRGKLVGYIEICTDITALKQLQQELDKQNRVLQDTQERVRLATETAGIGIWSADLQTGVSTWDAQQFLLFGREPADPAMSDREWMGSIHPDDRERVQATVLGAQATGAFFAFSYRIIRPDGALRHIKVLGSPRRNAQGQVDYLVGTNMDVTDAVLLQQSLQEARLRAEEASRVKSQFVANMSHEIRTPMHGVLGLLRLLDATPLDARQQQYLQQAQQVSGLMLRLIDGVLDHSKLEAHQMRLQCDAFAVDTWLEKLAVLLSASAGDKPIAVRLELPRPLPQHVVGDAQRLRQVLVCLIDNAVKFTASGEVVCQIEVQQQSASHCVLAFSVRDTGIGIAPESLARVFADFVQLDSGSTRAYGGVGLGLPLAQRLVQLMGGTIEVQSQPGVGSRFFFCLELPLSAAQPLPQPQPQRLQPQTPSDARVASDASDTASAGPTARPGGGDAGQPGQPAARTPRLAGMRVLVVEDNLINQHVLHHMLLAEGASVALADNGLQGVEAVRASLGQPGFDLVLMDLQMPVMDGYQAAREIRNTLGLRQLPIMAVSTNVLPADRAQSLAAGMDAHLGKPFMLDELVQQMLHLSGQAAVPSVSTSDASAAASASAYASDPAVSVEPDGAVAVPPALLLRDLATVIGAATSATSAEDSASMKAGLVVLADTASEADMLACIGLGAVDMVPAAYARDHLGVIARKHFDAQGVLRVDLNNPVPAIDVHAALARTQLDQPFFGSLLRAFLEELPVRREQLHEAWAHDPGQIEGRSHALKGLAQTLGLQSLADVARQAEARALLPQGPDAALWQQLDAEMLSARFQILRWLCLHPHSTPLEPLTPYTP